MLQLRPSVFPARGWPSVSAVLVWALAAASWVFWWLHSPSPDLGVSSPVRAATPSAGQQSSAAVARALGYSTADVAAPDAQRRFQLLGVIAADSGQGSALLAVDGRPAKAYVQGQDVGEGWRLQSVAAAGVRLSAGEGGGVLELALPTKP